MNYMADGLGGPPQGFGETIFDATKKVVGQQVKQTGQAIGGQLFGNNQQSGSAPQGGSFTPPASGAGTPPPGGLDNLGNLGKLFEQNKLGGKKPVGATPSQPQMSQQQLEEMQTEQQAKDAQEIARLTQELHQMYAKTVMDSGEEALKKQKEYMENLRKEEEEKWAREKEEQAQQAQSLAGPGQMQPGQMVDLGPVQSQSSSSTPITSAQRSGEAKHTE
jgi:hypothetical protein